MKIEDLFQFNFMTIVGNVDDKNKNIESFLNYYRESNYFFGHRIILIVLSTNINYEKNKIVTKDFENSGIIFIYNSTDNFFDKFFDSAICIVCNSFSEGFDLNLFKALKYRKPVYINNSHKMLDQMRKEDISFMDLDIYIIDKMNPIYDFRVLSKPENDVNFLSVFSNKETHPTVDINELITEMRSAGIRVKIYLE